jgi:hypothetical protein
MEASGLIPVVANFIPSKVPTGGWIILKIGMQSKRIAYCAPQNVYACHNSLCQVTLNTIISVNKTKAPNISDLTKVKSYFKCICCRHFQQELEMALLEFKTANKD